MIIKNMDTKTSNRQIAKNTIFLYLRMFVTIIVNFYTIRLLWKVLGIDDYGVYNVVGGIVLMFAFLNNAMVASSQRFISYAIGEKNIYRLKKTFSISLIIHLLIALLVLVLAESIGLWFINNKLNIPSHMMVSANWVYQCSLFSFIFTIVSVPYNACIVAHEHMKIYGYFGILEVFLKLVIVLLISWIPYNPLISYSVLLLCLSFLMRLLYSMYCRYKFIECHFKYYTDKQLIKKMFSFAGWSFLGNMGFSVRDQGINIILNIIFNVAINAAKGIANQVSNITNGFVTSFTMAINPQLTKRYATGHISEMMELLFNGCKYSLLLMSMIVIPLFFATPTILNLWLGDVAPYTIGFLQLGLIMVLIDSVVSPITTSLQATGKIRKFQIVISCIMVSNIPLAWCILKIIPNPYIVMYVTIFTSILALLARLKILHELIKFSYVKFIHTVYGRNIPFIIIFGISSWLAYPLFRKDFIGMIEFGSLIGILGISVAMIIGLNRKERIGMIQMVFSKLKIIK